MSCMRVPSARLSDCERSSLMEMTGNNSTRTQTTTIVPHIIFGASSDEEVFRHDTQASSAAVEIASQTRLRSSSTDS